MMTVRKYPATCFFEIPDVYGKGGSELRLTRKFHRLKMIGAVEKNG